ncbi:hypothetical protein [Mycobacterium gastri]|nr:hypothetical protein [Mycobacterium gastri]ETW23033.1 hypothetical protein MGAST_16445 [Mycobacterium gastri 'Wayne']
MSGDVGGNGGNGGIGITTGSSDAGGQGGLLLGTGGLNGLP